MDDFDKFYIDMTDEEKEQTIIEYKDKYLNKVQILFNMINYCFHNYNSIFSEEELRQIKNSIEYLKKLHSSLYNNFNGVFDLQEFNKIMTEYTNIEMSLRNITFKVYKHDLTDPSNFYSGEKFCFVVHCPTLGAVNDINVVTNEQVNVTSASLITDKAMGLFSERLGNYGYIFDFDLNNFIVSSTADTYSISFSQDEYDKEDYFMQFYKSEDYVVQIDDDLFQFSETMVAIPHYMEQVNVNTTIEVNGELLNYDEREIYNEIVLLNDDKLRKIGVFVRTLGDKNFSTDYLVAKELAEKSGLPLVEIDKSLYRERNGLEPLTKMETKKVIRSVARKINSNPELYVTFQRKLKELSGIYNSEEVKYTAKDLCLNIYNNLRGVDTILSDEELLQYINSISVDDLFEKKDDIDNRHL